MKSKVFCVLFDKDGSADKAASFRRLLESVRPCRIFDAHDTVTIKMHFGEEGNTGHIKPAMVRPLVDSVKSSGARPVLSDSNALYKGRRTKSADHLRLAEEHGFVPGATGAEVAIAEGEDGKDVTDVAIDRTEIKTAKVASLFLKYSGLVGLSHFKGHLLTGFGGTIKNIGMGCASRQGKLDQHCDVAPVVGREACIACGSCVEVCPSRAIAIKDGCAEIDGDACIGCAECIASCTTGAMTVDFASGRERIQERMAEYASAALFGKQGKSFFVNIAVTITQECDCFTRDFPKISDDVGIFLSVDPVAVDTAAYDAVVKRNGCDVFKRAHPDSDGLKQLRHGQRIGLGSMSYELVEV